MFAFDSDSPSATAEAKKLLKEVIHRARERGEPYFEGGLPERLVENMSKLKEDMFKGLFLFQFENHWHVALKLQRVKGLPHFISATEGEGCSTRDEAIEVATGLISTLLAIIEQKNSSPSNQTSHDEVSLFRFYDVVFSLPGKHDTTFRRSRQDPEFETVIKIFEQIEDWYLKDGSFTSKELANVTPAHLELMNSIFGLAYLYGIKRWPLPSKQTGKRDFDFDDPANIEEARSNLAKAIAQIRAKGPLSAPEEWPSIPMEAIDEMTEERLAGLFIYPNEEGRWHTNLQIDLPDGMTSMIGTGGEREPVDTKELAFAIGTKMISLFLAAIDNKYLLVERQTELAEGEQGFRFYDVIFPVPLDALEDAKKIDPRPTLSEVIETIRKIEDKYVINGVFGYEEMAKVFEKSPDDFRLIALFGTLYGMTKWPVDAKKPPRGAMH